MAKLNVPSPQQVIKNLYDTPDMLRRELVKTALNPPRISYRALHKATQDLVCFDVPLAQIEAGRLSDDMDALRAMIAAERAAHAAVVAERNTITIERDQLATRNARLEAIIAEIRRAHFGRKSERITDD